MANNDRERLVFHGAIVMFIGLLCGYPALGERGDEAARLWRAAHLELLMIGIWLLATAAVLPALVLKRREGLGRVWSLLATGYGLMTVLLIRAVTGVRGIQPTGPAANWVAFAGSAIGILGALLAVLLTLMGARAALRGIVPVETPSVLPNTYQPSARQEVDLLRPV
jgi:hypothetical protein